MEDENIIHCKGISEQLENKLVEQKQRNKLKEILKYKGQDIWEGNLEEMRSPR